MKSVLFGAMIGDMAGSRFERNPIKTKTGFDLISPVCSFTDDTVMTIAVASGIMHAEIEKLDLRQALISEMQVWGRLYPHAGYGGRFIDWIYRDQPSPYGSWGNGSAMRVSACGYAATSLDEAIQLAKDSAAVTHDHPEGIRGAQAAAAAVFLAKTGAGRDAIREQVRDLGYPMEETLDAIRPYYRFDVSCQGSVPQAIECFLESDSYEDTLRNAISLGGDSDTMAAIAGAIAWAYYGTQDDTFFEKTEPLVARTAAKLPEAFRTIADAFDAFCRRRGAI